MENELDILVLEQSNTFIYFRWTATEDVCRVKRDGQMVYTGTQNRFKDEGLKEGHLYTYTLERLDASGHWVDKIKLQTATEKRQMNSNNRLAELVLTTIVSNSRISLAWGKIVGITAYDIYRNGAFIETVEKNQYTDRQVSMNEEATYWIRGNRPIVKSQKKVSDKKIALNKFFNSLHQKSPQKKAATEDFWLTKKIASLDSLLSDKESTQLVPAWQLRYTTFLPDTLLKNPNLLSPFAYFQGDGRSFDAESPHYRSQVNLTINFNQSPTLVWDKHIGPTIGYNWRKNFSKADIASSQKIELEKAAEIEQKMVITLTHCVGNPLTTSPNIDYELSADFYQNGTYDIIGVHDQSPNHEVYLKFEDNHEWTAIHQKESEGLAFMAGPTASHYWRISNFY